MRIRRRPLTENVGFNMTPMIDIVFQLITFFMLVTDMQQRQFEDVVPPEARHAEQEKGGEADVLYINIHHDRDVECPHYDPEGKGEDFSVCVETTHWLVTMRGEKMTPERLRTNLAYEAQKKTDPADPKVSLRKVQIRADRSTPYEEVQRVLKDCSDCGIADVEFSATIPAAR